RRPGPHRPLTETLSTRWVRTAISFVSKLGTAKFDGKKVFERTSAANLANGHMQIHHSLTVTSLWKRLVVSRQLWQRATKGQTQELGNQRSRTVIPRVTHRRLLFKLPAESNTCSS